jgi:hypothetical protein
MRSETALFSLVILLSLSAPAPARAEVCGTPDTFSAAAFPKRAQWRTDITHANQDGGTATTSASRERTMRASVTQMTKDVLGGETPSMETHFAAGTDYDYLVESPGYGSHIVDRVEIRSLGVSGTEASVDATLLLPVSGHVGVENAKKWAVEDTYDIVWQIGDAQKQVLVHGAKSLGILSVQEVRIPLIKGEVVKVSYYRSGSLGPAGYVEGRVIELVWDGT